MTEAILLIDYPIRGYGEDHPGLGEIGKINKEISEYFRSKRIVLPIVPLKGMLLDMSEFYEGLSLPAKEYIDDCNSNVRIDEITICNGYIKISIDA